jgi:hypothetical protein
MATTMTPGGAATANLPCLPPISFGSFDAVGQSSSLTIFATGAGNPDNNIWTTVSFREHFANAA